MDDSEDVSVADRGEQRAFLILLGGLGLGGCFVLIAGTLVAQMFVPGHDWIADTISDLAAGRHEIFMDIALYGFAGGIFATALAASHAHAGKARWSLGVLSLAVTAALVVIIAARNEYGDRDAGGVVIHVYLVYGLGVLFLITALCMGSALRSHPHARLWLIGAGLFWGATAPVFFFMPDGYDGLYERGLGLIACAIICTLDVVFIGRGRRADRANRPTCR